MYNSGENHVAQSNGSTLFRMCNKERLRNQKSKVNGKCTNLNLSIPWFDTNFYLWNTINNTSTQTSPSLIFLQGVGGCTQATTCTHH